MVARVSPLSTRYSLIGRAPSAIAVCGLLPAVITPRAIGRARAPSTTAATMVESLAAAGAVDARDADVAAKGSERMSTATAVFTRRRRPLTPTIPATYARQVSNELIANERAACAMRSPLRPRRRTFRCTIRRGDGVA